MSKKDSKKNNSKAPEYDAFISYKHSDFDTEICLSLHKQLESYTIKKDKEKCKVKRVFLDTEELASAGSLSKSIQDALDNSRHLIVICSKETPQSPWVQKEIEYFVSKHGYDKVLALLIDGEPHESFPEPLRVANINGVLEEVEPLAADIRAGDPKQSKKALKREILRLLAPLLGMTYDELVKRHQKMVIRRIIRTASLVAVLLLSFGFYAFMQWQYTEELNKNLNIANADIEKRNEIITQNNEDLSAANELITEQHNNVLSVQSRYMAREALSLLDSGNRRLSLFLARSALPKSLENPDRPYVDEAAFALTEAIGAYTYPSGFFHHDAVFSYDSKVQAFAYDPEVEYITAATSTHLILRRIDNGEVIWSIPIFPGLYTDITIDYSADGSVIYTNASDGYLAALNASSGETIWNSQISDYALDTKSAICIGTDPASDSWDIKFGPVDLTDGTIINTYPIDFGFLVNKISISPDGRHFSLAGIDRVVVADVETGEVVLDEEYEYADVYLSDDLAVIIHTDYSDYTNIQNELNFCELPTGIVIDTLTVTGSYYDFYFISDSIVIFIGINGFVIYDHAEKETVHTETLYWVQNSFVQNEILFLATGSENVYLYNAETGVNYDTYSFRFPAGTQEILNSRGVFSGIVGSEIHIRKPFTPPGLIEFDVYDTIFLEDGRVLTRGRGNNDNSVLSLWRITEESDGTTDIEKLSALTLPYIFDLTFDAENMMVYCVTDGNELFFIRITDNMLSLEDSTGVNTFDTVHITQEGTPVLLGRRIAVINVGRPDSIMIEHSMYSADEIFQRNGSFIIAGPQMVEIITDGESAIIDTSDVYAVSPASDECAYYKDGQIIFKELFTESEKTINVEAFGKVAKLFYSPDGSLLFIATEALRLHAYNVGIGSFIELEADFEHVPQRAYYIGEYLAITSGNRFTTLWNPGSLKIVGKTSALYGYGSDKLVIGSGMSSGIVPLYSLPQLMQLADDILADYVFDEREVARYLS